MGFIAACLRRGELPLWDPYSYCGVPFYANIQAQLFYLPAWPFFALAAINQHNTYRLLECMVVLHIFLAGAFSYWLLRRIGLGNGAALFGGTIFQLGGFFASQTSHVGAICGSAWLPLAWLGVVQLTEGWSWRRLALLTTAFAGTILAGFPATMAAVVGSSVLLAVILVALRRGRPLLLAAITLAIVLAFLVSAVEVLPAIELSRLSQAGMRGEWTTSGGGAPLQAFASMLVPNYYRIFNPEQYEKLHLPWNPSYLYLYCGLAGLVLGILGLISSAHKYRLVFALLAFLCAFWMLCDNTPVGRNVFPLLPKALRGGFYPEFAIPAFLLAFAVLAALGAEKYLAPRGTLVMAILIAATAWDLTRAGSRTWFNRNEGPGVSYQQIDGSRQTLERMRELVNETVPPGRVDLMEASHNWAGAAPMLQAPTANGDDPNALWRILQVRLLFAKGDWWARYYEVAAPESPILNLLNIRFVLTRGELPPGGAFFRREELADSTQVYENRNVLPRFFLVNQVQRARDLKEALELMRSPGFEPGRSAVIESNIPVNLQASATGTVKEVRYSNREFALNVEASGDMFLVTSEAYFPGWRAWIDERLAEVVLTNAAFRGLRVPAGQHRIRMRFSPRILIYGAALSAATIAALAVGCFLSNRRVPARGAVEIRPALGG